MAVGRTVVRRLDTGAGSAIGNIVWFIVAGLWLALAQFVIGIILCLTIIGIPFGIACFKMAGHAMFPLGKEIVDSDHSAGPRLAGPAVALAAAVVGWRLRFHLSAEARAWRRGARGERRTARTSTS